MAGELRLDQHLPSKLVDAYVWRDATQAEVWYVTAELVTDASFNPSGNGYIDTEIRMWE